MLAESKVLTRVARAPASSAARPFVSRALAPRSLEELLHALHALRALASQRVAAVSVVRADAAATLARVVTALDVFHADLEQELQARHAHGNRFSALLVEHVRRCAARQRADVARVRAQLASAEAWDDVLQAAWTLAIVMPIEVQQLTCDVRV